SFVLNFPSVSAFPVARQREEDNEVDMVDAEHRGRRSCDSDWLHTARDGGEWTRPRRNLRPGLRQSNHAEHGGAETGFSPAWQYDGRSAWRCQQRGDGSGRRSEGRRKRPDRPLTGCGKTRERLLFPEFLAAGAG